MFKGRMWIFAVTLIIGPFVGLLAAAAITYVMPKKFESEAVIEVKPRSQGISMFGTPNSQSKQIDPTFFATEFEKIKCRKSLEKVIDNLSLVNRWNVDKETALKILKEIVTTQNIRGTDLISIRVRHTNKVETRDIADEVAKSYAAYRVEIETRDAESFLGELNIAVREQEDKVEETRKVLADIVRTKANIESGAPLPRDAIKQAENEPDYLEAKQDFEMTQDLLQQLKLKQVSETITRRIPIQSVEIHDQPVISDAPVSPNVTLNLVVGAVGGLLLSPLLALLVILVLHVFTNTRRSQDENPFTVTPVA